MKKLVFFFAITVLSFSCKKQQQASIVGAWLEVSQYAERSGQYSWGSPGRFPLSLHFSADGKYSASYDVSAGHGNYIYDYSTRTLQMETISPQSMSIYTVTYLNDHYMVIEYSADYKLKFARL